MCVTCSAYRAALPYRTDKRTARVCDKCYPLLIKNQVTAAWYQVSWFKIAITRGRVKVTTCYRLKIKHLNSLQLFVKVIGKQAKALPNMRPFQEEAANDPEAQASGHLMVI